MEKYHQEESGFSRYQQVANEAAMFVEKNVVIAGQQAPVYAGQLDRFVSIEEGHLLHQIRCHSSLLSAI